MKIIASIFVALALSASPAFASWAGHDTFKGVKCDDADVVKAMLAGAPHMKFANGGRAMAGMNGLKITSAKTVKATADTLICQLRLSYVYRGSRQTQSGRLTIQLFSGDRFHAEFNPS